MQPQKNSTILVCMILNGKHSLLVVAYIGKSCFFPFLTGQSNIAGCFFNKTFLLLYIYIYRHIYISNTGIHSNTLFSIHLVSMETFRKRVFNTSFDSAYPDGWLSHHRQNFQQWIASSPLGVKATVLVEIMLKRLPNSVPYYP